MFEFLKRLFGKKPTYNIKLTPEVWQQLPNLLKQQISELQARVHALEQENAELKKKIEEFKGKITPKEVKVLQKAIEEKKKLEAKKNLRRIALVPFAIKNTEKGIELVPIDIRILPYAGGKIVGKRGVYKYFAGWELEETENGLSKSVNFLFKTDKKSRIVARISPSPSASVGILDEPYLVAKLVAGTYELPIKVDGTLMKVYDTSNPQINAYIESLQQEIAQLRKEKEELEAHSYLIEKKYQELTVENNKLKKELALASYRADLAQAGYIQQTDKVMDLLREHGAILTSAAEAQLNEMLERRMNWILADKMKELRGELENALGKPIDDVTWGKIEDRFYTMLDKLKETVKQPTVPKVEKTEEKGEKK